MEEDGEAEREAIAARMRSGDYTGARTLLLQTLQTNPSLDDAVEMLAALEVLCAANRPPTPLAGRRSVDWYMVLQVMPGDGADRIEARYRTLVDQLEPVRDGLPGADLALRLVNDAYEVLSDPEKRARFDSGNTSVGSIKQLVIGVSSNAHFELRRDVVQPAGRVHVEGSALLSGLDGSTGPCGTNPEVDRLNSFYAKYVHHTDGPCLDAANGSDIASSSKTKSTDSFFLGDDDELQLPEENHVDKKQKSVCEKDAYCESPSQVDFDDCFADPSDAEQDDYCFGQQYDCHNFEDDRSIEHFTSGQIWAAYDWEKFPRRYALINRVLTDKMQLYVSWFKPCPQFHEEKKWLTAGLPFVCGTFMAEERQISVSCPSMFSHELSGDYLNQHLEVYPQNGEVWAIYSDWHIDWCSDPEMRKKSAFSVVEILTSYSTDSGCMAAPLVKVDGCRSVFQRYRSGREQLLQVSCENLLMFSHRIPSFRFTHEVGTALELEHSAVPENLEHVNTLAPLSPLPGLQSDTNGFHEGSIAQFSYPSTSNLGSGIPQQQGMMNHNNKLSAEDFVEGQIWAAYDARDRMPRSYVRIIRVVSHTAVFVLKLEPHPMLNEEIRWVEDGLPVACGVFRAGTETSYKDMSDFSHPVQCDWSSRRSFYRIFPKKGEIWAMYKNWKITLNSTDIDNCEPRMVEILSDYTDETGVNACSLTRVKGCLSFFQRVLLEDFHLTRWISRSEMLSFSHRVPAFVVIEIRERDIPQGSWHLEPSALPLRTIH
uniref:Uncharacterized protein n=1 Tax=Avena sativa TaxID=4498 RepID=A0ACD5WIM4_AVESA